MSVGKNLMRLGDSPIYYYRKRIPSCVRDYFKSDFFSISTKLDSLVLARRIEKEITYLLDTSVKAIIKDRSKAEMIVDEFKSSTKSVVVKYNFPDIVISNNGNMPTVKHILKRVSLDKAMNEYIEHRSLKNGIKNSTENNYSTVYYSLKELLGIEYCDEINVDVIKSFIQKARNKYSDTTLKVYLSKLKSFFQYLEHKKITVFDSGVYDELMVKLNAKSNKAEFSLKQIQSIFDKDYQDVMNKPAYYFVPLISLVTGMRISEIMNLQHDDVKIEDDYIYFIVRNAKTFSGIRTVPITKTIKFVPDFLKYYSTIKTGKVFTLSNWSVSHNFTNLLIKKGVKESTDIFGTVLNHSFHSLRHTFNVKLEGLLIPDSLIDVIIGHAPKSSLSTYSKKEDRTEELYRNVMSKLSYDEELKFLPPFQFLPPS